MKLNIETAFKKLLGDGFLFRTLGEKTSDFLDVLINPLIEVYEFLKSLKSVHFSFINLDKNNVVNSELMFSIIEDKNLTLLQRAQNIIAQWGARSGSQTFLLLENFLKKSGFLVSVIENVGKNHSLYGSRLVGNGFLRTNKGELDPIEAKKDKHIFIVKAQEFFDEKTIRRLIELIVKNKPLHNGAYFIPKFLRKREIHQVMTKKQMQQIIKAHYCDCRRGF